MHAILVVPGLAWPGTLQLHLARLVRPGGCTHGRCSNPLACPHSMLDEPCMVQLSGQASLGPMARKLSLIPWLSLSTPPTPSPAW